MIHMPKRRTFSTEAAGGVRDLPMRLFGVVRESIVDGPNLRFVVFVQGCPHHCPGCHNPLSHDPAGGYESSTGRIWQAIRENPLLRGVTFSGGEPFLWGNELYEIGRAARAAGMDVMTYSGYTWEALREKAESDDGVRRLLSVTNYLVDGRFVLAERDLSLQFRGSRNQRIWDVTCYPNSRAARLLAEGTADPVF